MPRTRTLLMGTAALVASLACSRTTLPGDGGDQSPPSNGIDLPAGQAADWKAVQQLETQAKALAHTEGCAASADCRAAAVGSQACGGPRYYIPWCARSTDSAALYSKLAEVARAEQAYNKKYQIISTCQFRLPPTVASSGGSCVAQ